MRPIVSSILLSLIALSASAQCLSRTLLSTSAPIYEARVDRGALYFSIFGQKTIQRLDEATGQTTVVYTADVTAFNWSIDNGMLAVQTGSSELTIIAPSGVRRVIDEPLAIRSFRLQDGYLYWVEDDNALRRVQVIDGPIETVASGITGAYRIFDDRVVFAAANGLYWQSLSGGVPMLLLPRSGITAIDMVTADAILISASSPPDPNVSTASVLRVPWTGGPVETIYQTTVTGYVPSVSLVATIADGTTYIVRTVTIHFFSTTSTLVVVRDGVARDRFSNNIAVLGILAADEDAIIVGQWIDAGGMRRIERLCADAPKRRSVR